jgi:hypothetical protein
LLFTIPVVVVNSQQEKRPRWENGVAVYFGIFRWIHPTALGDVETDGMTLATANSRRDAGSYEKPSLAA